MRTAGKLPDALGERINGKRIKASQHIACVIILMNRLLISAGQIYRMPGMLQLLYYKQEKFIDQCRIYTYNRSPGVSFFPPGAPQSGPNPGTPDNHTPHLLTSRTS